MTGPFSIPHSPPYYRVQLTCSTPNSKFLQPKSWAALLYKIQPFWLCSSPHLLPFTLLASQSPDSPDVLHPAHIAYLESCPLWTLLDVFASDYALLFIYNKPPPAYLVSSSNDLFGFFDSLLFLFVFQPFHENTLTTMK